MFSNDNGKHTVLTMLLMMALAGSGVSVLAEDEAGQDQKEADVTNDGEPKHTNLLIHATSPYLLQHAHNPVDWYEWGDEALAKAQRDDKMIFLSIGYAACHWCHVMEREVFEDEDIAKLLNQFFVCIKVDREERPDIDTIYMQATMAMTGNGGWPMSVFLTPNEEPFTAGTYFPKPTFDKLLRQIIGAWRFNKEGIDEQTGLVLQHLKERADLSMAGDELLPADAILTAANRMAGAFDTEHGGVLSGRTNKFPPHTQIDLMLRAQARSGSAELLEIVNTTLTHMVRGGIYDQLGGGICRYSTDPEWFVPHFEKMLYDQALVSNMYLDAYQLTGDPLYADTVRSIFEFVLDDLQSADGGIYSSRDADSEGAEGLFYIWTRDEVIDILGEETGEMFATYFGMTRDGNWYEPHRPGPHVPHNILHIDRPAVEVALEFGMSEKAFLERIDAAKKKMLDARSKRVHPGLDDKVLAEWNGMMIGSLAKSARVLNEPKYAEAASRAADFVLDRMVVDGKLMRSHRLGKTQFTAYLSDYVFMIDGLLKLYEATFDPKWIDHAQRLADGMIERYDDPERGGFFYTAEDAESLIVRMKDANDGAIPSANQLSADVLLRLASITGMPKYREIAEGVIKAYAGRALEFPWGFDVLMRAVDFYHGKPKEIVIVGDPDDPATRAMLDEVYGTYRPNKIVAGYLGDQVPDNIANRVPLLKSKKRIDGKTTAYVCENHQCKNPVTSVAELKQQLADNPVSSQ